MVAVFIVKKVLGKEIIFDHFVPRHQGGRHDHTNRVAAHSKCDGIKGNRLPTEQEVKQQLSLLNK